MSHVALRLDPNNSNSKVRDWIWVLVEHVEEWEKFSWGSKSYQISLKAVMNVRCHLTRNDNNKEFQVSGNILASMLCVMN